MHSDAHQIYKPHEHVELERDPDGPHVPMRDQQVRDRNHAPSSQQCEHHRADEAILPGLEF